MANYGVLEQLAEVAEGSGWAVPNPQERLAFHATTQQLPATSRPKFSEVKKVEKHFLKESLGDWSKTESSKAKSSDPLAFLGALMYLGVIGLNSYQDWASWLFNTTLGRVDGLEPVKWETLTKCWFTAFCQCLASTPDPPAGAALPNLPQFLVDRVGVPAAGPLPMGGVPLLIQPASLQAYAHRIQWTIDIEMRHTLIQRLQMSTVIDITSLASQIGTIASEIAELRKSNRTEKPIRDDDSRKGKKGKGKGGVKVCLDWLKGECSKSVSNGACSEGNHSTTYGRAKFLNATRTLGLSDEALKAKSTN